MGGELTGLQRAFVDAWFECRFNGTEAARVAGYSGDNRALAARASENVRKRKVREEIDRRWAAHGMTAEEVTARYAEQARVNIADFLNTGGGIDWDAVEENGHLIKKITHRKGQESTIELHNAQHALDMIGKTMAMFTDKQAVDVTTKGESLNERGVDTKAHRRATALLTDAFRAELADIGHGESGAMGANEQAAARRDSK